jgi:4-amino-4-deoxy-L-arabinose transferase-like glycosyltransferase
VAVAVAPAARGRGRLRSIAIPRPLAALLVACTLISVAWAVTTAPLQGPDEHNHYGYVQHLAETGSGPSFGAGAGASWSTEQQQWHAWQNLLGTIGIVDARPGWNPAEEAQLRGSLNRLPGSARKDGSGPNPVGQNPPLYYAYESIPYWLTRWTEPPTRLLFMRLANLPLYLLAIGFAWLAAGEVFRSRRRAMQTITAGVFGLLPQLTFMSGVLNPDILLTTLWAAMTWLALVAVRTGPTPKVLIGLGVVAGGSAFTHGRGLAAAIPLALILLLLLWRARRALSPRLLAWMAASGGLLVLGVLGTLVYSSAHGGGESIGGQVGATGHAGSIKGFLSYVWQFYLPPLRTMSPQGAPYGYRQVFIEGLGGTFSSLEITFPLWVYDALQLCAAAGLAAFAALVVRRWEAVRAHGAQVLVLLAITLGMFAVLHASAYRSLQGPPFDPLLVGRYLLPMAVPMALVVAFVCRALPRRVGAALGAGVMTLFMVLSLAGIALTVSRFYA